MKKRFAAIILALILSFSPVFSFADGLPPAATPGDAVSQEESIGTVSLSFIWDKLLSFGHVWIYVHNTSDEPFTVGAYTVNPDEGVSLGSFGLTRFEGFGIYYNVEAYCCNEYGAGNIFSMTEELCLSELERLTAMLLTANYWDIIFNCSTFAATAWNCCSDSFILPFPIPLFIWLEIILSGGEMNAVEMHTPCADEVFRQTGFGDNAELKTVDDLSLLIAL